jgi:predicted O-methyltransferase YrrM
MYRFDYPDWSSVHHTHWKTILDKHLDLESPLRMIEVGCFEGRSTMWFAGYLCHNPLSRLVCIDTWQGGEEIERLKLPFDMLKVFDNFCKNVINHDQSVKIFTHKGSSESHLSSLLYKGYQSYDFIYLDASHTRRDTLVDLTLSLLLVKKGGVIIIDDYNNNMATKDPALRPRTAVDFIVETFDSEVEFYKTPEQQAVIIRK